jgi:hypothetical protein
MGGSNRQVTGRAGVEPARKGIVLAPRKDKIALDVMGIEDSARTPALYTVDETGDRQD